MALSTSPDVFHAVPVKRRSMQVDLSIVFLVWTLFAVNQFMFRLGIQPLLLLAMYAWVGLEILRRPQMLVSGWVVLIPPLIALLLIPWSVAQGMSIIRSIQFLVTTLMGIVIAHRVPPHQTMLYFCGFSIFLVVLSLLNAVVTFLPPAYDGDAFIGVLAHKNWTAHSTILAAAACVTLAAYWRLPLVGWLLVVALFPVLEAAQSAGGKVLYVLILLLPLLFMLRKKRRSVRRRVLVALGIFGLLLPTLLLTTFGYLIPEFLTALGKDATLTGRTVLWAFAVERAMDFPLTGYGYDAFWTQNSHTRQFLRAYVDPRTSQFHQGYLEILVDLGLIGGGLAILSFLYAFWKAAIWYLNTATVTSAFFVFYVVFLLVASFVEPLLFSVHSIHQVMLAAIFVYACQGSSRFVHRRFGLKRLQPGDMPKGDYDQTKNI